MPPSSRRRIASASSGVIVAPRRYWKGHMVREWKMPTSVAVLEDRIQAGIQAGEGRQRAADKYDSPFLLRDAQVLQQVLQRRPSKHGEIQVGMRARSSAPP